MPLDQKIKNSEFIDMNFVGLGNRTMTVSYDRNKSLDYEITRILFNDNLIIAYETDGTITMINLRKVISWSINKND